LTSFVIIHDITERKWAEQIKRNLGEYEETIQEQERRVISRKVHDEIGQNLTALKLDLSWIEHRFPSTDGELTGRLKEMRANLDQLITVAQQITADLRPPLLDNLGLAAAIDWQVSEFERRSGIECHRMLNEDIELSNEHAATTILRIFQEALTNVVRHAGATEVSISLCERDGRIILEVSDNGRGATVQDIDSFTAYGIMGMRERAAMCNGELSVIGIPGKGTTVKLSLPRDAMPC
jgi:signal transduction histidine kinase